jgi:replication-associated recombination protein RarA
MSFARKWMELKIIMVSEIARLRKTNTECFLSYVEARSKEK